MLTIEKLECGYGKLPVLRGVSFTVGAESVGLFGPNGAGQDHADQRPHGHGEGRGRAASTSTARTSAR